MTLHQHERRDPHHPLRRVTDYRPDGTRTRRWSRPERFYRLTYRQRPFLTFLSTVLTVLLPTAIVVAATQLTVPASTVPERKTPSKPISWTWDDGAPTGPRTFLSHDYVKHDLPAIRVKVPSADVNTLLYWQFLQDGVWENEWLTKANTKGIATIPLDPYCTDGSWCDGTYEYRLKIGTSISSVEISFWDE